MTLVTQCIMHARQKREGWCCTSYRSKHINYLTKMEHFSYMESEGINSKAFKRSNNFGLKELSTTVEKFN